MKKILALGTCAAMILSLAACGGSSTASTTAAATTAAPAATTAAAAAPAETTAAPAETTAAAAAEAPAADFSGTTLVFASDAVGSGSYNQIVEMSKTLENEGGFGLVDVQPISPGGMGGPYLFADGAVDLAFLNAAPAKWATETGTLGKEPTGGYSAIAGGLSSVCYINCISNEFLKKYNVSTIEEIFEQKLPLRIGCSAVGSMDAEGAYLLLEYFGVTQEDLESWGGSITNQSGSENEAALQDGKIDFYIDHTSGSSSTMAEIATTCDVTFLQWGDELIDWFVNEKGFQRVSVPAASFKGQDAELILPGSPDSLFCRSDLDEEVVYQITKVLSENRDALVGIYSSLGSWDVETCMEAEKLGGNPLHPGAERYYKEMGYIK
ncbi:MAG: TAXI family TRAP transporter solute-binding subunit [Lachnospiraceae bacterium]|nr:TAXI family TRAP transporter solute-binding subunit [Lachnospiraceae bacterium]